MIYNEFAKENKGNFLALQAWGRRFESDYLHFLKEALTAM